MEDEMLRLACLKMATPEGVPDSYAKTLRIADYYMEYVRSGEHNLETLLGEKGMNRLVDKAITEAKATGKCQTAKEISEYIEKNKDNINISEEAVQKRLDDE